ncbi:hypothetical protein DL767_002816 [Monosporascus sp. MG133]|nr:hypothetical protein DL767_002816 [Monosporascus sp. MG133]
MTINTTINISSPKSPSPTNVGSLNDDAGRFKNMTDAIAKSTFGGQESDYGGRGRRPGQHCGQMQHRIGVVYAENGTFVVILGAVLPKLDLSKTAIDIGKPRADDKLQKGKCYADVVYVGKGRDWVLNQWTVMDAVMEPVTS